MKPSKPSARTDDAGNQPKIGLFIGDPTGIGPEVTAKALSDEAILGGSRFLVIGDDRAFKQGQKIAGVSLDYAVYEDARKVDLPRDGVSLLDLKNMNPETYRLGQLSPEMGRAVGESTMVSLNLAKEGRIDAFVYAPINKEALNKGGYHFDSELSFIAHALGLSEGYGELTALDDLWTSRVTSHIGIREVAGRITRDSVLKAIVLVHSTLRKAKAEKPRIGVSALNPHGGEGGLFGPEEAESIAPAVQDARGMGIDAVGPYPADTIFLRRERERLDAIVSMYHDQGQIATKLLGFNRSVTVSGGLPFPITTPSHGTAFDIAGKGLASPDTLKEAIKLASRMSRWRPPP
jgi:4-hydroxythreonine-4-phosphate dehydrogenase